MNERLSVSDDWLAANVNDKRWTIHRLLSNERRWSSASRIYPYWVRRCCSLCVCPVLEDLKFRIPICSCLKITRCNFSTSLPLLLSFKLLYVCCNLTLLAVIRSSFERKKVKDEFKSAQEWLFIELEWLFRCRYLSILIRNSSSRDKHFYVD